MKPGKFLQAEKNDPAHAVGTFGRLKMLSVAELDTGGVTGTYANNEIGIHRVENRTDKLACTFCVCVGGVPSPPTRPVSPPARPFLPHGVAQLLSLLGHRAAPRSPSLLGPCRSTIAMVVLAAFANPYPIHHTNPNPIHL